MDSRTYYDMAAFWPTSSEPYAAAMNDIPKVVFSRKTSLAPPSLALTSPALRDAMRANAEAGEPPDRFRAHAVVDRTDFLEIGELAEASPQSTAGQGSKGEWRRGFR